MQNVEDDSDYELVNLNSYYKGEIEAYMYMVDTEVKPCASTNILTAHLDYIKEYIKNNWKNLSLYIQEVPHKDGIMDSCNVYIYKYPHIKIIIDNIDKIPKDIKDWYLGKLFGYSDNKINEFIIKKESK